MNLKYRKVITRIKPLHKACRYVMYNSTYFFYKKIHDQRNYSDLFALLKGSKSGRCFIIGNGPSLSSNDLDKLVDEDCFGTNEIHRIFNQTRWRPKYYVIMDRYSKSTPQEIERLDCQTVFLSDYYWKYNVVLRRDAICLHQHYCLSENSYKFSEDIEKCVYNSPTVSYAAMQIAAFLGYKEIYLLGFDHNYSYEFDKKGNVIRTGQDATHFFQDEKEEEIIGNVWGMTKAYESFQRYADKHNIVVRNATRGGKLEVFARVNFDSLFPGSAKEH